MLTQRSLLANRSFLARVLSPCQVVHFSDHVPKDNMDIIPDGFIEHEKKAFKERVSEKKADFMAAQRLVNLKRQEDYLNDDSFWWNKLSNMTKEDFELMPMGYIRKYGSYMTNL